MNLGRIKRDKAAVIGLVVLLIIILAAVVGPYMMRTDPAAQDLSMRRKPPSIEHLFGRDQLGRDVFARVVFGARYTLLSGLAATALGAIIGLILGLIAGYYEGWTDEIIMRAVDLLLAFPFFLLAILIIAILGGGLRNATIAVAITQIPKYARLVRSSVLQVCRLEYTESARAVGARDGRIMWRHILPNVLTPAVVLGTVSLAETILYISGLSFLGLGAQPPLSEWGLMLSESKSYFFAAPHIMLFPGLMLAVLVLSINLVGDGLRYVIDPHTRGR